MPGFNQRHMEMLGPDLGRGPFATTRTEMAIIQIATALAQARAPLTRADADLLAHGDFIRQLADRLAPDYAAYLAIDVGNEISNAIPSTFRTALTAYSLLDCWLADSEGGGLTGTEPDSVTFNVGTVLQTIVTKKRFLVLTTGAGVIDVTVSYAGTKNWYWAVTRQGRVFYSDRLQFA